jgi:hypothetical protein
MALPLASSPDLGRGQRAGYVLVLLFAFSMAFMQPAVPLLLHAAVPSDFIFLALFGCWAVLLVLRKIPLVFDRAYLFIGAYFLAIIRACA